MTLSFLPETWTLRTPLGGQAEILDPERVRLGGGERSYIAFDREIALEAGWVELAAECRTQGLADPCTAATVMLSFVDGKGEHLRRQYADSAPGDAPGVVKFHRLLEVPKGAVRGVVTLALRWPRGGYAVFTPPFVIKTDPPPKREARIAVTYFKPSQGGDFFRRIPAMLERIPSPDMVVFSESLHTRTMSGTIRDQSEPMDGPYLTMMSDLAAKHHTYLAANLNLQDGELVYNTTALLNRSGSMIGTYRKVHLPLNEIEFGVSAGSEYPVFATDFAKVGLTICWDATFPESARSLRLNGAELMINSTMGDFWPQDMSRAIDNGMWFAIAGAGHSPGNPLPSRVIDPRGNLLCACGGSGEDVFASTVVDFSKRYYQYWMSVGPCEGEPMSLMVTERRPETYL